MNVLAIDLVLGVAGAVAVGTGWLWGLLHRWVWALVHGSDRTRRASLVLVAAVAAVQLTVAAALAIGLGSVEGLIAALVLPLYALGLWLALRLPPADSPADPREPADLVRDHDGVRFTVRWRPAWVSALVTALAVGVPFPLAIVAAVWSRSGRRARVHVRNDAIDVDGLELALHGARLEDGVAWDGTPVLRLASADRVATIPLGGLPGAEVRWTRELLERAIAGAEDTRLPPQPETLRRIAARAHEPG